MITLNDEYGTAFLKLLDALYEIDSNEGFSDGNKGFRAFLLDIFNAGREAKVEAPVPA